MTGAVNQVPKAFYADNGYETPMIVRGNDQPRTLRPRELYEVVRAKVNQEDVQERIRDFNLGGNGSTQKSAANSIGELHPVIAYKKPLLHERFPEMISGPDDPTPDVIETPEYISLQSLRVGRLEAEGNLDRTRRARTDASIAAERKFMDLNINRFDPDFFELRLITDDRQFANRRKETIEWLKACPNEFQEIISHLAKTKDQHEEGRKEAILIELFLKLVRAIYDRIHCPPGSQLSIRDNGSQRLKRNASLKFVPGHGGDWSKDLTDSAPDIVIITGKDAPDEYSTVDTWEHVDSAWEVRYHVHYDMRSHGLHEINVNIVPCMLSCQVSKSLPCAESRRNRGNSFHLQRSLIRNRPVTGRTNTLTLAGPCLRLWEPDATTFASSRLCRLDNPAHAEAIVDIIAFLTAPAVLHKQRWTPDREGLLIRGLDQEKTQCFKWADRENPYKWLDIRVSLFGSRPTAFAGKVNDPTSSTGGELSSSVVKTSWTFQDLKLYELRMLSHLHGKKTLCEIGSNDPDPAKYIDPLVMEHLPKALGEVIDSKTHPELWTAASLSNSPSNEVFSLSIIATMSAHAAGRRMPRDSDFTFETAQGLQKKLGLNTTLKSGPES
jgi:hypothetical protein